MPSPSTSSTICGPRFVPVRVRLRGVRDVRAVVARRADAVLVAVGLQDDRPLSLGEHLLLARAEMSRQVTTIILLPELVTPGAVPPGVTVAGSNPPVPAAPATPGLEKGP